MKEEITAEKTANPGKGGVLHAKLDLFG